MTDETTNLMLEQFRILRAEIEGVRSEIRQGFATLSQRLDHLETEVRGVNYVATVSIGSVLAQLEDLKARVKRLEDA
jgi:hypothetical protein